MTARLLFGLTNIVGAVLVTAGAWLTYGPGVGLAMLGALMLALNFAEVLVFGRR